MLDLWDSMYFYDKGLILAGYASSVEMMMSFAMFCCFGSPGRIAGGF